MGKIRNFIKILFGFFLCVFILIACKGSVYAEDTEYYSNLTPEQIEELFALSTSDVSDPWNWISDMQTFVIVQDSGGKITYWWNTPNIQMSIANNLYDMISTSGYGSGMGVSVKDNKFLVDLGDTPHTAMQKYGFHIPNPVYIGERPLITISITDVLLPDSPLNILDRLSDLLFSGDIVSIPTDKDLNTLMYIAPRDYDTANVTFHKWVEVNWYSAMDNIAEGQILLTFADQETGEDADGKYWVKKIIIDDEGLSEPGLSADYICEQLKEITGSNYTDVAKNIIIASGILSIDTRERIMPYDLKRMNVEDAEMFEGVSDPRAEMQQNTFGTGYLNNVSGMKSPAFVEVSGFIAEISVALNGIANFSVLENLGFNPVQNWNNSIITFLLTIMIIIFLFFVVKSAFQVVSGTGATFQIVSKIMSCFLICLLVYSIGSDSGKTYDLIKNVSTSIFNIANVSFENNETTNNLYGTGDASEKADAELWLPYFDTWSIYNTNHSIFDEAQTINIDSGDPELLGFTGAPEISGVKQTLWSTVLADPFTTEESYPGSIYRVVDHFMAPRILSSDYGDDDLDIKVEKNENYNGNIQSSTPFSNLFMQLLILFLVILKVLLFIEFLFNLGTLVLKLSLSVMDKGKVLLTMKELGASSVNIAISNVIISLVIWTCLITTDIPGLILCGFYVFILYHIFKALMSSNSVFTPKFFRLAQQANYKMKDLMGDQ